MLETLDRFLDTGNVQLKVQFETIHMKTCFVCGQVRHKPDCSALEVSSRLEISNLENSGFISI